MAGIRRFLERSTVPPRAATAGIGSWAAGRRSAAKKFLPPRDHWPAIAPNRSANGDPDHWVGRVSLVANRVLVVVEADGPERTALPGANRLRPPAGNKPGSCSM